MNKLNNCDAKNVMPGSPQRRRDRGGCAEKKRETRAFWQYLGAPSAFSATLRWRKLMRLAALVLALYPALSLATRHVVPSSTTSPIVFAQKSTEVYYPGPGESWERRTPQQVGMDPAR